uniref:Uncharacterized protein n=1 Tax=Megaselia scalaris TaxID=36166 RepID=T1H733_MEGSC
MCSDDFDDFILMDKRQK